MKLRKLKEDIEELFQDPRENVNHTKMEWIYLKDEVLKATQIDKAPGIGELQSQLLNWLMNISETYW